MSSLNATQLVVLLSLFVVYARCVSIGDDCSVARSGIPGTCQSLFDQMCTKHRKEMGSELPNFCGISNGMQLYCCPKPLPPITTTTPRPPTRPSHLKCDEYAALNEMDANGKCYLAGNGLVVGGEKAVPHEFPHMVRLAYKTNETETSYIFDCGGTLISDRYVLTAAHCVFHSKGGLVKLVRLNMTLESDPNDVTDRWVIGYHIPQTYNKYTGAGPDIALLKLNETVEFSKFMRPACLAERSHLNADELVTATGWGRNATNGTATNDLMKVSLELFSHDKCQRAIQNASNSTLNIPEAVICAGSTNSSKDTCQGDSGGPLQLFHAHNGCMYEIFGVTSFGYGCGVAGQPAVYTRVFSFLDSIEQIVWPEEYAKMNPDALNAGAEFVEALDDDILAANVPGSNRNNPLTASTKNDSTENDSTGLQFSSVLEFFALFGVICCIGFCILLFIYHKRNAR